MTSWANVAKKEATDNGPPTLKEIPKGSRIAVVDANALIDGVRLETLADRCVTTREVLEEVRDQRSLQYIQTLPFGIETAEPTEDAVKHVLKFARATGDIHSLSRADVRLIALALTLEVQTHGSGHIRNEPGERRVVKHRKGQKGKGLPGWDFVRNEDEWAELDKLEGDTSQPNAQSRILGSGQPSTSSAPSAPTPTATQPSTTTPPPPAPAPQAASESDSESEEEEEDDGWNVAKKGRARRRAQRKEKRMEFAEELAKIEQERALRALELAMAQKAAVSDPPQPLKLASWATVAPTAAAGAQPEEGEDAREGQEEGGQSASADQPADVEAGGSGGEEDQGEIYEVVSVSGSEGDEEGEEEEEGPGFESTIQSVTNDFAMQNVILQMGLRLTARDGHVIKELSRYALRCSACFAVTKDMVKIFCPRCGNQALDKVQITVGPDGMEQFGVKKRHILRGTRYSLPNPKGGRVGSQVNPILREDILLTKQGKKIQKKIDREAEGDPFAPEFNDETWHKINQLTASKGIAFATSGAKNNPNERKFHRSNRRK